MKPTILLFNFSDMGEREKIARAGLPLGIAAKKVKKSDYRQPLGVLLGQKEKEAAGEYNGLELPHKMLLMAGLSDEQIQDLLDAFRTAGVPRINHKAVLTEINQTWNALQLYKELNNEYEYFKKQKGN